jgi:hypothetical protein
MAFPLDLDKALAVHDKKTMFHGHSPAAYIRALQVFPKYRESSSILTDPRCRGVTLSHQYRISSMTREGRPRMNGWQHSRDH